jgi:hypothetical protein
MTKLIYFTFIIMVLALAGCRQKVVRRDLILDATKPYKIPLIGNDGDKFRVNIQGHFSGKIKVASTGHKNELTEGNFSVYLDSIDLDLGFTEIYTDNTENTWYIRPVDAGVNKGTVTFSSTEVRW